MEFIDKSQLQNIQSAHTLLNGFLTRCNNGGFKPEDDLYQKMQSDKDPNIDKSDTTYNILRRQLLKENNYRCCYCMRSLNEEHTTLEHVIPNKTETQDKYDDYKTYYSNEDWQKLVFAKAFLQNPRWPNVSYPHTVAYENLIPSCDGKFAKIIKTGTARPEDILHPKDERESKCCNIKRGNNHVVPFVFSRTMVSEFRYTRDGIVIWPVSRDMQGEERKRLIKLHKDTIDNLQLNCPELVAIRRIWFFLSAVHKTCDKSEMDRTVLYLTEDANLTGQEEEMLKNFWQDNYWSLLKDYTYFNDVTKFT